MNLKKILVPVFVITTTHLMAQSKSTITACQDDSIRAWLTQFHVPAVAIGIIENDKIKSVNYYGETGPGITVSDKTLWNVASLTKPVTATTVMALVNEGKWDLDKPVSPYFVDPDIKDEPWTQKLTTRIFLSHQTGFKNWKYAEPDQKLHFHFEPGTKFGYSGVGYEYLRQAVEKKFGKDLGQLAREELFAKAGITDTHYSWNDQLDTNRFAWAYSEKGVRYNNLYKAVNAADWLVTTMNDYCRFGLFVINGERISKDLFNEITRIQVHMDTVHHDDGMGLGWEVIDNLPNGEYCLTHNGSDQGVATLVLLFPKSKRGIVIFTNGDNGDKVIANILKNSKIDIRAELAKSMGEFR